MSAPARKPRRTTRAAMTIERRREMHMARLRGAGSGQDRLGVANGYLLAVMARLDEKTRDELAGQAVQSLCRLAEQGSQQEAGR